MQFTKGYYFFTKSYYLRQLLLPVLLLLGLSSFAADQIRSEQVLFKQGSNSAVVESSIKGYQIVDYVLGAGAGQHINVSLATKHRATYFNIMAPGETDVAFFNSSMAENQYEGTLPASGNYTVRVYMMRAAARRNELAKYRLEMIIDGAGISAKKQNTKEATAVDMSYDAKVPGTDFHATGDIPCSKGKALPMASCPFGVKRQGNGRAVVTVTKGDGAKRVIFFEKGTATGYDKNQADTAKFTARKKADVYIVSIGDEHYEIFEAIVFGG